MADQPEITELLVQGFRDTAYSLVSTFGFAWDQATPEAVQTAWLNWRSNGEPTSPIESQSYGIFENDAAIFGDRAAA